MKNKNLLMGLFLLVIVFGLTSCAPEGPSLSAYGFFSGIWHGMVFPFALIGKLFGADIGIYAQNNTGFFYWFGYIIGLGGLGGGGYSAKRIIF